MNESTSTMKDSMPILLVEDFDVMRKAQVKVLSTLGYQGIVEARDGRAAVEILPTGRWA